MEEQSLVLMSGGHPACSQWPGQSGRRRNGDNGSVPSGLSLHAQHLRATKWNAAASEPCHPPLPLSLSLFLSISCLSSLSLPLPPRAGADLQVCKHPGPTCCTRKMEESYLAAVRSETLQKVRSYSFELKYLMRDHASTFQGKQGGRQAGRRVAAGPREQRPGRCCCVTRAVEGSLSVCVRGKAF